MRNKSSGTSGRRRIGEIGQFIKGSGLSKSDLRDHGVPCLRYAEIYTLYGSVVWSFVSRAEPAAARGAIPLVSGDIVFAASGETAEEIGKALAYIGSEQAVVGGDAIVLRGHGQDAAYLAYALNADDAVRQKARLGQGQSIVHIRPSELALIDVWLPPIGQQRRIAEILRTWDEAIEKSERLITAKEKLLKQRREDFAWSRRGELISLGDVLTQSSVRVGPGRDLRVFSVTKDGLVPQDEHFNKRISNEDVSRHMLVEPSDFALSGLNFWLGSVDVSLETDPFCISPDYKVFKIGDVAVPGFFRHLVRTDRFRQILKSCAVERASVVRKNFDREAFLASQIPLPDRERQEAVLHVLSTAEQELVLHHRQRDALVKQQRGLMQKLLTGEWPVKVPKSQEAAE